MNKENFILNDIFNVPLSKVEFLKAKDAYLNALRENQFSIQKSSDIYDLIRKIKRSPERIGPYQNISVFEALNRIGSDLILLSGAEKLFNGDEPKINPKTIELRMGNTHGFDFVVNLGKNKEIYGEAFNAATSFCKQKMRQAIHKLIDKNPDKRAKAGIVFINEEVREIIKKYINNKELESEIKIYRVYCNDL